MRLGIIKKAFQKTIAWTLVAACLLPSVERLGGSSVVVKAKESISEDHNAVYEVKNATGSGKLSLGWAHTAAIKADNSLWMWGSNYSNELGIDTSQDEYQYTKISYCPIRVMENVKTVSVSLTSNYGHRFSAAIKTDGSLWMWGANHTGQLGNNSLDGSDIPIKIMENVKAVSLGSDHSAAIKTDGSLWMWGSNEFGQLGNESIEKCTVPVKIMDGVKSVSLGVNHSAAIKEDGSLWMWGINGNKQLGDGTSKNSTIPIQVMENVKEVSLGNLNSAAIKEDGSLWIWGANPAFQLDNGQILRDISKPVQVMENVKAVSLGVSLKATSHCAVIKNDDTLWMWGDGHYGRLGNNSTQDSAIPIQIMENVMEVSLGSASSGAVKKDGSLWTWGDNSSGMLGNESTYEEQKIAELPIQIMAPGSIYGSGNSSSETDLWTTDQSRVKVVDSKGKPIENAHINYSGEKGQKTVLTNGQGIAVLSDFVSVSTLTIKKENYVTKTVKKQKRPIQKVVTLSGISDLMSSVVLKVGEEERDLLTTEVKINRNAAGKKFTIECVAREKFDVYELYSGNKKITDCKDGIFADLNPGDFKEKTPVYLSVHKTWGAEKQKICLNLRIVNLDIMQNFPAFSLGDGISFPVPENIPILGGTEISLDMEEFPVVSEMDMDGTMKVGINVGDEVVEGGHIIADKAKDWFSNLKSMNKKNAAAKMAELKQKDKKNPSGEVGGDKKKKPDETESDLSFDVIGYLEGNIIMPDYLRGRLFIQISAGGAWEQQATVPVGPFMIPVVVEVSIEGEVHADGSITFTLSDGYAGADLLAGGEFVLGLYAGVGIKDAVSAGIYGEAGVGLDYQIFSEDNRGVKELYIKGEAGIKGKFFSHEGTKDLISGTYNIIPSENYDRASVFSIDNDKIYDLLSRYYLTSAGTMPDWTADSEAYVNGSVDETLLQGSTCLDLIPQIVRMGDTVMLFYLADAGAGRDAANRSQLVYSLWDQANERWGEPKAVLTDDTADFNPDLYADGNRIYAVWQEARESLSGNLTLNEIVDRLTLHAAVYDVQKDEFVDLGLIESENGLYQQNPQIVADGEEVSVYWHENAQDNVLGLSGANRIYRASLTEKNILTNGIQVMSISEGAEEPPADTEETPDTEKAEQDEESARESSDARESEPDEAGEESPNAGESEPISGNTTSAFRKLVALTEEGSVSENTPSENNEENTDGEENDTPSVNPGEDKDESGKPEEKEPTKEEPSGGGDAAPEKPEESVSENTIPEETVSENSVSENTISKNTLSANSIGMERQTVRLWEVTFLREEADCIYCADAGRVNGSTGYAYTAGKLDDQYDVTNGRVVYLPKDKEAVTLDENRPESVEFTSVYAGETLTWYQGGDIYYLNENGSTLTLFGEGRLPSSSYALLSDGNGNPEVLFPVNINGKSELYRIGKENGAFTGALQITEQEDYIQYADGFLNGGQTILVYNRMKVNDRLEEVNNSLCTGIVTHSYHDIVLKDAATAIRQDTITGEDILEISALLYNNGTKITENVNLSISKADGTLLETVALEDLTLKAGEAVYRTVTFDMQYIQEAADYLISASIENPESNVENNQQKLTLGDVNLQVYTEMLAIADTRSLQIDIWNTGVVSCGGNLCVRDTENGKEYYSSDFEPITRGQTVFAEILIDNRVFAQKDVLLLEVTVTPKGEGQDAITEYVSATAPKYRVSFVTADETQEVWVSYGAKVSFPQNPTKEGKHFIGWYDAENPSAGTLYTEETPITKDLTLYACFADEERTQIPLSECSVSEIPTQFYTGKAFKPKVTVKWGSEVLKENKDYKVSYKNNKNQGRAAVTITAVTGKGKKYSGSIVRSFSIMYPTSKVSVKAIPAVNFTGEAHTPEPVVTYQKKTLTKDKDYTVSYFNNRNAGTAGVTITGKGTFSGEKTVTFQIKGTAISGMKFDKIPDVTYNGQNTRPTVTVRTKDGKTQLMSGSDYRLVYENMVNKGTASVTVIGNGNYTGTKKLTYKVVAKPLAESMIAVEQPAAMSDDSAKQSAAATADLEGQILQTLFIAAPEKAAYTYTGKPIKPTLTVTDQAAGDAVLVLNKDYTVSYSKNKAVGEAQITVKGKGNYSGTVKVPFTISPVDLAQGETAGTIRVKVNDIAYTGKALKPAVQVYETVEGKERKLSGGAYTLTYGNNTEKGTGTVIITGKGKSGYSGTVTAQFRIVDKAKLITASAIKIDGIPAQTYTGSALEPALHIVDKGDKNHEITLESGTHYEVTYRNNVNAGKATVTVKGIGSYAGSKDLTFKIGKRTLANKNGLCTGFTVENPADLKYTGNALKPDMMVKDRSKLLVQGKDYKLSYKNNTKIGTAAVTVTGLGNYSGSYKEASFAIKAWDYGTLTAEIEDQTYTGKALKPQVKFYMTGENGREEILLRPNTTVKIAYKDNKNAGTATVMITGKGVLKDIAPIKAQFVIERADVSESAVSRIPNQTLKGMAVKPIPKVKVGKNSLKVNRDFTVSYIRNGVKGEATAIIKGVGNYTGECRKTFIVQ